MTSPAARRLRLLRDLDEALGVAYARWPGEPPRWLVDVAAAVEIRLERARNAGEYRHSPDRCRPPLPPAGARP